MKKIIALLLLYFACALTASAKNNYPPAPNGIEIPKGYQNWQLLASSHREDNHSLRIILANKIAMDAVNKQQTDPWPDGAMLAKLVWKDRKHPQWEQAQIPGEFMHSEFMIKDSRKYAATGGWGFARWKGLQQIPYGKDASFAQECFNCHGAVKNKDYVFTMPAVFPKE